MTDDAFDWATDDSVAVQAQPALAVYPNKFCQVVIRRERDWNEEEDCFIQISRENVLGIVRAILIAADYEHAHLYEQRPGGACYDIDWPEGPLSRREVVMMNARPDINWQAALEDFNEVEAEVTEPEHVTVKERRARVSEALKADPCRSNRSIAADCGVSDKTVGTVRAEIDAENTNDKAEFRREDDQFRLVAAE